jgi:hypothetical protein
MNILTNLAETESYSAVVAEIVVMGLFEKQLLLQDFEKIVCYLQNKIKNPLVCAKTLR